MIEIGTYGVDADGNGYAFGPGAAYTLIRKDGYCKRGMYTNIVEIPNDKGYKVEWDITFEDEQVSRIYTYTTDHNIAVYQQHQEEELWMS